MVLVGALQYLKEACVIVDDIVVYKCKKGVDAVYLCFQIYHIFNIDYPFACPHIWSYIQEYGYGLYVSVGKSLIADKKIQAFQSEIENIKVV